MFKNLIITINWTLNEEVEGKEKKSPLIRQEYLPAVISPFKLLVSDITDDRLFRILKMTDKIETGFESSENVLMSVSPFLSLFPSIPINKQVSLSI